MRRRIVESKRSINGRRMLSEAKRMEVRVPQIENGKKNGDWGVKMADYAMNLNTFLKCKNFYLINMGEDAGLYLFASNGDKTKATQEFVDMVGRAVKIVSGGSEGWISTGWGWLVEDFPVRGMDDFIDREDFDSTKEYKEYIKDYESEIKRGIYGTKETAIFPKTKNIWMPKKWFENDKDMWQIDLSQVENILKLNGYMKDKPAALTTKKTTSNSKANSSVKNNAPVNTDYDSDRDIEDDSVNSMFESKRSLREHRGTDEYTRAFRDGYEQGYEDGYDDGYDDGFNENN